MKVVNMGELFAHSRLFNVPMKRLEVTEQELQKSGLAQGDLLFARRSLTAEGAGKCSIVLEVNEPTVFESSIIRARLNNDQSDSLFYYYFFNSPQGKRALETIRRQVSVAGITGTDLAELEVPVPPLSAQRCIARTLGLLDEKTELNRQTARTLEELAQRLFKSWFVDFDPVRAKMAGRQPSHMPPETAALFPDKLVDSPLGPIPEGWEVKPIEDIVTIKGGATPNTKQAEYWEGGTYHWATPKDLSGLEQKVLIDTNRKITSKGVEKISSGQLPVGTVLMSSRAPVGYLALADMPVSINQGFIAMICSRGVPNTYILHWAESAMDVIKSNAGGSTFAEISKKQFRPLEVVVPPAEIFEVYDELAGGWFERISLLAHENVILGKLRDHLLPKLISGEVRVPEAQQIAEEA